jgi:hypothetical protein
VYGTNNVLKTNHAVNDSIGFHVVQASSNALSFNRATGDGTGFELDRANHNTLTTNTASGDTFGFAVLAGSSADGRTIQILISNYAIPSDFEPNNMQLPADVAKSAPLPDFSKFKFLPRRTDIVYRNNGGYNLTINHLPWGKKSFHVRRYRISQTQDLDLIDEKHGKGDSLKLQSPLAPDALELIVLEREQ